MSQKMIAPQTARDGLSTEMVGGKMPSATDVIKSANARGGKRHDMKGNNEYADVGVLPSSGGSSLDKDGIQDTGYLEKKGLKYGANAFYNTLPPGMNIEDQENIDSRQMPMKMFKGGLGYPGDGGF